MCSFQDWEGRGQPQRVRKCQNQAQSRTYSLDQQKWGDRCCPTFLHWKPPFLLFIFLVFRYNSHQVQPALSLRILECIFPSLPHRHWAQSLTIFHLDSYKSLVAGLPEYIVLPPKPIFHQRNLSLCNNGNLLGGFLSAVRDQKTQKLIGMERGGDRMGLVPFSSVISALPQKNDLSLPGSFSIFLSSFQDFNFCEWTLLPLGQMAVCWWVESEGT